jgi:dihydroorotase
MTILIRQVLIAEADSPYNRKPTDILIEDGIVRSVKNNITDKADRIVEAEGLCISSGWIDCFASVPDPGFEFKETIESASAAAAAGGFTTVFTLPNNNPVTDSKGTVEYILKRSHALPVQFFPLGAVSKRLEGKELAEMYDMQSSGAVAFSDGTQTVASAGLLLKALQYVKSFDGTVIQLPYDKSIAPNGLMHEGIESTQLGMQGSPALAEELIIHRDLELLAYTNSRLHITGVTTQRSLELISNAKQKGLNVTCSVTPFHLLFCDEDLREYNSNLKMYPPLRSRKEMTALREAVKNGTVDFIATHHQPQDTDSKQCEFEYAKPGMISLQTAFHMLLIALPELSEQRIAELLSLNAAKAFKLPVSVIKEGACAQFTLFSKSGSTPFRKENNRSRSANSLMLGEELPGRIIGTFNKGQLYLN